MEFVYVVKRYDLFDLAFPHGFEPGNQEGVLSKYINRIKENGFFIERKYCEKDSGFKQIIPYAVLARDNQILVLKRTALQGESRLHNKQSIGVGGHINPVDDDVDDILMKGCRREIEEELVVEEAYDPIPVGIINDESNEVGSVHFGVVYLVRIESGHIHVREKSMMTAEFIDVNRLKERLEYKEANFETWSSLIIASLDLLPL
jgi:predicted NUDIX family phosphoesterase